jgi:hypothetical protein
MISNNRTNTIFKQLTSEYDINNNIIESSEYDIGKDKEHEQFE